MTKRQAVVGAVVLFKMLLMGCAPTHTEPARTPHGIRVSGEYERFAVDFNAIDAAWRSAADCMGYTGSSIAYDAVVVIMEPSECESGECFECRSSTTLWCAGEVLLSQPMYVRVTPDLAALLHEFAHLACWAVGGDQCGNYAGRCGL